MASFVINVSGSGDIQIGPTPAARQIVRVLHWHLTADKPVTCKWFSGPSASGNLIDGTYSTNVSGGGLVSPMFEEGVMDTTPGQPLILNLSGAANVIGAAVITTPGLS
jgi:hypothetical protein